MINPKFDVNSDINFKTTNFSRLKLDRGSFGLEGNPMKKGTKSVLKLSPMREEFEQDVDK